jgi:hypothetical protein
VNWKSLKLITPAIVLLSVLAFAYFSHQKTTNSVQGQECSLVKGECTLIFSNHQVTLKISPTPISIEEELKVVFAYSKNLKLHDAWVEGNNMFMGRMQVIIDETDIKKNDTISQGILFLGSCNLKSMTWILFAEFEELDKSQPIRLSFRFSTQTN